MIGNLFGCLLGGVLCALVLTALCVFIANSLSGKRTNILIAIILALLLGYECVLGIGALYARGYVSEINDYVGALVGNAGVGDVSDVADAISSEFPAIPSSVMDKVHAAAAAATSVAGVAEVVAETIKDSIMTYFWTRVAWALAFMVAGTALLVYLAPKNKVRAYRGYSEDLGAGTYDTDYSTTTTSRSRYTDYE